MSFVAALLPVVVYIIVVYVLDSFALISVKRLLLLVLCGMAAALVCFGLFQLTWMILPETVSDFVDPVVEEAHLKLMQKRQYWMIAMIVSVLVIAAMLIIFLAYRNRQHRQLALLNSRLALSNEALRQSNHIKTVYIGRYMKMTTLSDFDDAFLELFPDFVAQVKDLLVPESELRIKPKERLNTDLRVLALIHLGITDSRQIADFLRYSLSTIYNSRTRMRNWAKGDRDEFEQKIAAL